MNNRGYDSLVGKRFGKLIILHKDVSKTRRSYFICKCSCGKKKSVYAYHLKTGKIKSCGCTSNKAIGKNNPTYSGYEEISGSYWGKIKEGAKSRRLKFSITLPYVWKLFILQHRRCAISGVELKFNTQFGSFDGNASLDRIDSSKGYVRGNVQWLHKTVNKLKTNLTDAEVVIWAKIISENNS